MPIRYFGDGSGRDSYIVTDFGGMVNQYKNQSFEKMLRQSPLKLKNGKYLAYTSETKCTNSMFRLSPGAKMILKNNLKYQKEASKRLASPKRK